MTDKTAGLLPPDSSHLFEDGELQEHNFAASSFTEDDVGTGVHQFDLTTVETSNVETMERMFLGSESFDQNISGWCVKQITEKPDRFDEDAGFEGVDAKQPNWGEAY